MTMMEDKRNTKELQRQIKRTRQELFEKIKDVKTELNNFKDSIESKIDIE